MVGVVKAIPASAGHTGAAVDCSAMWWAKAVQVTGLTAGSLQLEGTIDNANWASVGAAITAVGIYTIDTPLAYIRVNASAATGSSLAVTLFGSR